MRKSRFGPQTLEEVLNLLNTPLCEKTISKSFFRCVILAAVGGAWGEGA